LYAQAGNDTLVYDALDGLVDGGEGLDTLFISDAAVDLVRGSHPVIQGIEVLDLTRVATNNLTLDVAAVRAMSGTTNQLLINADVTDTIGLSDYARWSVSSSYDIGNDVTTKQFTQDGVILKIVSSGDTTAANHDATPAVADVKDLTPQFRVDTIELGMSVDAQSNSHLVAVATSTKTASWTLRCETPM
jgi:hypothetical protein